MIKNIFVHNWKVKLVSLLLAFGFWTYVSAVGVKIDNFPGGVPLEVKNVSEGLVAITDIQKIEVTLVAEKKYWSMINEQNIKASINLSNLSEGTYELSVQIDSSIAGIQIESYTPEKVLVRIEKKTSKEIPITVKIEGSAGDGLVPSTPEIDPEKVTISGPKSTLDNILEATAVIRLDGETDTVNKKVKLVALDAENQIISGISFNPSEVNVNLPIIKAEDTKTVGIKVITTGLPTSGFWISDITTDPATITITGKADYLKTIIYVKTKEINIGNIDKNTSRTIDLDLPAGITAVDQIDAVLVGFEISAQAVAKSIEPKIVVNNLQNYLKIDFFEPSSIKTEISGDSSILNNVNSDTVKLNLDLGNYLTEGEYYIEITNSIFNMPEGVTLVSFAPSSIKIKISKK